MREDDGESRHFVGTMLCLFTSRGDHFDTLEMVKMQLTRLGHVELYRIESAGRRAC